MDDVAQWILTHGEALQIGGFFGLLFVFAVAERLWPRRPGTLERATRWPANLALLLLNLVTLLALPVSLIGAAVWAEARGVGLLHQLALPLTALFAANLALRGFISFAQHWLMHHVPMLWRLHRVHHLDTELDVTSTIRFHPLEFIASSLLSVPLVVAFGLTPWMLAVYELLDVAMTLFTHANLRLPGALDHALRYLVVTPDLHRVHHSAWQPETNSNYGAVFPCWDLLLGTFRAAPREHHATMRLGLDEVRGPQAHRLPWLLASVLRKELSEAGVRERAGTAGWARRSTRRPSTSPPTRS